MCIFGVLPTDGDTFTRLELYTPDQWEIDKDSVALDRLIGQGHFGQVYHGTLRLPDGTTKSCAVKVGLIGHRSTGMNLPSSPLASNDTSHGSLARSIDHEVGSTKIPLFYLHDFSRQFQCYHVIQLYGICSRIRPPYVVMELMENGDLKNYLYRHRQSDVNVRNITPNWLARSVLTSSRVHRPYLRERSFNWHWMWPMACITSPIRSLSIEI